jgi:universal stress protein E
VEKIMVKRFNNILCVLMGGEQYGSTLERAVSLAENNQARLTVVDVLPRATVEMADKRAQELRIITESYRQRIQIEHQVLTGTAFLVLIQAVLRCGHDLLIKPAENPSYLDRLFGSDDMHLLRKCPCPVWLTGPEEKSKYERILAAVDFDPERPDALEQALNQQIMEISGSLAIADSAELHVVHVWDAPGEMTVRVWSDDPEQVSMDYVEAEYLRHQKALDRIGERLSDRLGADVYGYLAPRFHLRRGVAATVIPEVAMELQADLVVMGTVARTGIPGLFIGNTAEAILEQLRCSVLAVKPPGFVSPVTLT